MHTGSPALLSSPPKHHARVDTYHPGWACYLELMLLREGLSLGLRCRMNLSRLSTWGRSLSAVVACAGRMSCRHPSACEHVSHAQDLLSGPQHVIHDMM